MNEREFLAALFAGEVRTSLDPVSSVIAVPRGDDAAVVRYGEHGVVLTADSFVEGRHFSLDYFSPAQVGSKAVEAAASDVIAMGGRPQYLLWSLVFGVERPIAFYQDLAAGVRRACTRLQMHIVGGNLSQGGSALDLSMTVVGEMPRGRRPVCRSGARVGDAVMVTGSLGGSAAGRHVIIKKLKGYETLTRCHLQPRCRFDLIDKVGAHATSMIDVSDGLAHELYQLSVDSQVGFEIVESKVPVHPELKTLASAERLDALQFAYGGGEDYELLFTVPRDKCALIPATVIGEVVNDIGVWSVGPDGKRQVLAQAGFDHFSVPA